MTNPECGALNSPDMIKPRSARADGYDDGMDTGPALSSDDGDSDEEMTDTEPGQVITAR